MDFLETAVIPIKSVTAPASLKFCSKCFYCCETYEDVVKPVISVAESSGLHNNNIDNYDFLLMMIMRGKVVPAKQYDLSILMRCS